MAVTGPAAAAGLAPSLAEGPLFGLPLPDLWFALVFFLLGTFLLLDGFDFGVGMLFATRDDEAEREQLLAAIGPFWDGNEVWLVVFGGALFAAFPPVYATLFSRHYLVLFGLLGALICRGLAPEMYEQRDDRRWKRLWGRAFVAGSAAAPFLLGVFTANWVLGSTDAITLPGVVVGLALVALCVADGAAFLGLKVRGDLRNDAVGYGTKAIVGYLALVVVALAFLLATRPDLREALLAPTSLSLVGLSVALAAVYSHALRSGRFLVAFVAVAGLVFGLVALVGTLLYPVVDPATGLAVDDAIVSTLPLNLMTVMTALLLPLVFAYFGVLYSSFRGPVEGEEGYSAE